MFKNLSIISIIAKIICLLLGLPCLYWSFCFITANANFVDDLKIVTEKFDPADEGKMIIAKGNLNNNSTIYDSEMNVSAEGISEMKRIVEMVQYRKKGSDSYSINWFSYHISPFAIDTSAGNERFYNPEFPKDLQTQTFYSNATLGNTGLSLTKNHFIYLNTDMRNLNRELVGINFDRNTEGMTRQFMYDGRYARSLAVSAVAVLETLRNVYGAEKLADELTKTGI